MCVSLPDLGRLFPVCVAAALSLSAVAQCDFEWQRAAPISGTSNRINAIASVPGQGLYAAGLFEAAGEVFANRVALWNGYEWAPVGAGVDRAVNAISVEPNGDLLVGGFFTEAGGNPANHLAKWNGVSWSSFAGGTNDAVNAFGRMANGDLLIGGTFTTAGGLPAKRVATWDGTSWTQVGTGIDVGDIRAVLALPNGNIAVGGRFLQIAGVPFHGVAIWNGTTWIDPGLSFFAQVFALALDLNGDLLIAGNILSPQSEKLARWNGTSLQYLAPPVTPEVRSILVEPNGAIVVGGARSLSTGAVDSVARFENGAWTLINTEMDVTCLAEHNGKLVAAGGVVGIYSGHNIREYDGTTWESLSNSFTVTRVDQLAAAADGGVYVAGLMDAIGGFAVPRVAHWDGSNWSALGASVNGHVTDMVVADNGDLVVAGLFSMAGGAPANQIARWNGSNWATLGAGLDAVPTSLASLQSGGVVALVNDSPHVRLFDGSAWTSVPNPPFVVQSLVSAVEMLNGDLVVAGLGGGVARWDGTAWTVMSTQLTSELAVKPDGTLIAAGFVVSEWDGSTFVPIGAPFEQIRDLTVLPNGDVIASGSFDVAGQAVSGGIVRWDGANWTPVNGGASLSLWGSPAVNETAFTVDGELIVVGQFGALGGVVSANIGRAISTCPATVSVFGSGCAGSAGSVSMAAQNQPWLGATFVAETTGMAPVSLAVLAVGTTPVQIALPLGAPGCSLYVQPVQLALAVPNAGTVATSFAIPSTAALVGMSLRTQTVGIELDAALSITSLTSSNALDLTIGAF